jgi:hypothetical protein
MRFGRGVERLSVRTLRDEMAAGSFNWQRRADAAGRPHSIQQVLTIPLSPRARGRDRGPRVARRASHPFVEEWCAFRRVVTRRSVDRAWTPASERGHLDLYRGRNKPGIGVRRR